MRAWLLRHGWLLAIAAAYLYVFPYFPKIQSANELPRVYLVKAMAEEGTFAIDRGVARWGGTADVSPWRGHQYSNKAPGSSMLVVPVYIAFRIAVRAADGEPSLAATMWLCRVLSGVLPMLLFLRLLDGFLRRWAPADPARRLVLVGYALGSMAMTYSILYISHQLAAVCVGAAWILALDFADGRRPLRAMAAAGFLAGASVLVEYQAAFALPVLAAHVIWRLRRARLPRRELARALAVAAAAAVIPIAVLLAYHQACFDSPLRTGYDASETFAGYHQQGFLGITELRWEAFHGSTFSPDNGLFTLSPWWLLAFPGAALLWRRRERERDIVLACGSIAVIYVLFISSINFWRGGWSVGPRYITVMLPFLLPFVATSVEAAATVEAAAATGKRRTLLLGAAAGTIAIGVIIYTAAAATFPHWPDRYRSPLYEVTFRLLADGLVAPSLGSWLGLGGIASALPYFALVAGLLGWSIVRAGGWRTLAVAAAVAIAVIGSYSWLPRTPDGEAPYQGVVRPAVAAGTTAGPAR
ncbi:MAG TPA: hypothetical protein VNO30_44625 [Kofleriaceae bacterium]|nr:hypothetical protein [Kofleriaceae bacterium]